MKLNCFGDGQQVVSLIFPLLRMYLHTIFLTFPLGEPFFYNALSGWEIEDVLRLDPMSMHLSFFPTYSHLSYSTS